MAATSNKSGAQRFTKLILDHPVLFAGAVFTGYALFNGIRLTVQQKGTGVQVRKMMRWRIYGQSFTLSLMAYTSLLAITSIVKNKEM